MPPVVMTLGFHTAHDYIDARLLRREVTALGSCFGCFLMRCDCCLSVVVNVAGVLWCVVMVCAALYLDQLFVVSIRVVQLLVCSGLLVFVVCCAARSKEMCVIACML